MSKDENTRERLAAIGRMVDEELPDNWGFILMAFPYDDGPGRCNYVAKCNREDGIKLLKEFIAKNDNENFGKHIPDPLPAPEQGIDPDLMEALEASVKLQSHYANLLNMHDGGERMIFQDAAAWLRRLSKLRAKREADV